jgi:CheY-specific phosphatase CheX
MPEIPEILSTATSDVLETMFFTPVIAEAAAVGASPVALLAARLSFSGAKQGTLAIRISAQAAETMAASFLGEEEGQPPPDKIRDVICELANMICGSVLSRLDSEAHFDLGHPELVDPLELQSVEGMSRAFDIGDGEVAVLLHVDAQI